VEQSAALPTLQVGEALLSIDLENDSGAANTIGSEFESSADQSPAPFVTPTSAAGTSTETQVRLMRAFDSLSVFCSLLSFGDQCILP
jgi:hypothetical protein